MSQRVRGPDEFVNLLSEVSDYLLEKKIITHRCRVGLVEYDPVQSLNRYRVLYSDLKTNTPHELLQDGLWKEEFERFRETLHEKSDEHKNHACRNSDYVSRAYPEGLDKLKQLYEPKSPILHMNRVATLLKNAFFYEPITTRLFIEARNDGLRFAHISFPYGKETPSFTEDEVKLRQQRECDNKHCGHWLFGVLLELLYLRSGNRRYTHYAGYFLRDREAPNGLFMLAAYFSRTHDADQFGEKLGEFFATNIKMNKRWPDPFATITKPIQKNTRRFKTLDEGFPDRDFVRPTRNYQEQRHYNLFESKFLNLRTRQTQVRIASLINNILLDKESNNPTLSQNEVVKIALVVFTSEGEQGD